jgi:hypothetical protein
MSSKSNKYFNTKPGGPNLKDYQHASRLFVDDDMRLAPKTKYLYHVVFNINTAAINLVDSSFKFRHQNEINMLVKNAELPRFSIQTDTLNQYNRKKNVQVKVDYQPVQIRFHDDNNGVTRRLWEAYFKYYYADPTSAQNNEAYFRNAMKSGAFIRAAYGLDNNSFPPFFNDITIYQMAKKQWNSYKLVNPLISAWNHDSLDYSSSQPAEQSMTLIYESVAYGNGIVGRGSPPGFGIEHYDGTLSPVQFGAAGTIAGAIQGATSVFGAISTNQAFSSPINALATAITAVNTYQNVKSLSNQSVSTSQAIAGVVGGLNASTGGFTDINFPVNQSISTISAIERNITRATDSLRNLF